MGKEKLRSFWQILADIGLRLHAMACVRIQWQPIAYDGLRWHANGSVSGSKNETEHLEDAPHYESHRRYDGMRYRVEQHEEKAKYDHSAFDFTIQHGASPEARFYLQSY